METAEEKREQEREEREKLEEHKGTKDGSGLAGGRGGGERLGSVGDGETKAGKKNEEYREKQEGTSLLERPKHLRAVRSRESSRPRGDVATPEQRGSTKTGKKHLTLVKRDAAGGFSPCSPFPSARFALYFVLFSVLSLHKLVAREHHSRTLSFSFSLSLLALIRRNFHRKFSLQRRSLQHRRRRQREPAGSECSVVFISTPNEFAERFAPVRLPVRSLARLLACSRTHLRTHKLR